VVHPVDRAERRRLRRLAVPRWETFVRDIHKVRTRHPSQGSTAAQLRRLAMGLASRRISWQGSDKWWKHTLRQVRDRRERKALRIEREDET
jgi:hypothetical protein